MFLTDVNNTGDKFITGANDTGEQLSPVITSKLYSFIAGVVDTADKRSFVNISREFSKKFETVLMGILRSPGNNDS
jgi:hypothetical protein